MTNTEETQLTSGIINSVILQNQIHLFLSSNKVLNQQQINNIKQVQEKHLQTIQKTFKVEDIKTFCLQITLKNYNYDKVEIYYFIQIKEEVSSISAFQEILIKKYAQQLKKLNFQYSNQALYTEYELIENINQQLIKNRVFFVIQKDQIKKMNNTLTQQSNNSIQGKMQRLFIDTASFYQTIYEKLELLSLNTVSDFVFMIKAILIQNKMTVMNDLQILLLANSVSEQITGAVQNGPKQIEVLLKRFIYDIVEKLNPTSNSQYNYDIKEENNEVCPVNIMGSLSDTQKKNIYMYFKYIKDNIITKMTYYLKNPLYTQQLGKILFPTLINRNKYMLLNQYEYKLVFSSKTTMLRTVQELQIAFDVMIKYLGFQLQNYDIKASIVKEVQEITFEFNFSQNIFHTNPMVMGPLTTAPQQEQDDFKFVFGEAAHIRHFQSGENKYCVDNREIDNIFDILQKYLPNLLKQFGLKDAELTFQTNNFKQINKILPKLQQTRALFERADNQIYQTMENIKNQIQSNIKLHFVMRDYEVFNFNAAMLELPVRKKNSDKKTNTIKIMSTLDFQVQKDFALQTYQAILTFKQLFIEQIVKFMNLNVNERLLEVNASGFNVKVQFSCKDVDYEMVLEIYFILTKELDFLGLANFEREQLIRLLRVKTLHNSFLKNLEEAEIITIKLVKRFIAAHLIPLFALEVDFATELNWNLFSAPEYKHFNEKFGSVQLDFFKDDELKHLFNDCNNFLNKKIEEKPESIYAANMINEELIEQLCAFYMQNRSFYDKNNVVKNFQACILFLASITEFSGAGVVFSTLKAEDLYLNQESVKNKVKVFMKYDPDAALSLNIHPEMFAYNNFNRIASIAAQQQFSAGIFKPSVQHVTHVLVLRDDIRFSQFNHHFQISVASRTVKAMKQVSMFDKLLLNVHTLDDQWQKSGWFQYTDPLKYVVSMLSQFKEFRIFYDFYGGTNIYLQFAEQKVKDLDLTKLMNQRILPDKKVVTDEQYIVSQILLRSGVFAAIVVEEGRSQWEDGQNLIPSDGERYVGVENDVENDEVSDGESENMSFSENTGAEEYEEFEEGDEAE